MTPFQNKYYNFWTGWVKANKFLQPFDIDFEKPFWHYLYKVKFHVVMILINLGFTYLFNPIFLIYITKAILDRDLNFFIFLSIAKILQHFIILPFGRSFVYLYDTVPCSFKSSVQKLLIQIDPVYFTTKSSGEIVAKIERTINALHTYMSTIFETIIPFVISIGVSIWLVAQSDWKLSILVFILFIILCYANIALIVFNNNIFLPKINHEEEVEKQYLLENIQQNHYIRSTFATPEQLHNTLEITYKVAIDTATKWRTWQYLIIILEMLLIATILVIVGSQVLNKNVEPYIIVGMLTSLYSIYTKYHEIGLVADEFTKSIHNQQEFWQFMRSFGKQTFPVIETQIQSNE
jgi:ABC-type multidrug transport system fused ATPase/permease subunit